MRSLWAQRPALRGAGLLLAGLVSLGGCAPAPPTELQAPAAPTLRFAERAAEWGLDFQHENGRSGERYSVEVLGAGVALLDYDGDGDLDVFLVQGALLGPGKETPASLTDRLFRNDLEGSARGGVTPRFVDVTLEAGLGGSRGYGMGVATGDYDNDGHVDLYITRFGAHQLWRNRGDGSFEDTTARAGAANDRLGSSATFFDYDQDGHLDLFVGYYVDFSYQNHRTCFGPGGAVDYCGPATYRALPDRLLRNRGNGAFDDATATSGIAAVYGPALGVVAVDLDGDGWQDLYVANDGAENQLWINQRDGTFVDEALIAGCAVNAAGATEAGMGVDAGDFDGDGDFDLFLSHLGAETNTLYVKGDETTFADGSRASELGPPSFATTGFGTRFLDFDLDGWLDLLVVNGAIKDLPALVEAGDPYPLHEPNHLYRNLQNGRFAEVSALAGPAFALSEVSRGAAIGDLDGDGDLDAVVTHNGGPARLLANETAGTSRWLGLELVTGEAGRSAYGAVAKLSRPGQPVLLRRVGSDGSYLSASDPKLVFGLGSKTSGAIELEIWHPPSPRLRLLGLSEGRSYRVKR